mmetsp:Transcript_3620/g.11327  ORF Transcript_3620/g.11327 Transcript_3620/m.11327 type:complete len:225 (+) Transcript_3620:409-1083(+)
MSGCGSAGALLQLRATTASNVGVGTPSTAHKKSPSMLLASPGEPNIVWQMCTPRGTGPNSRTALGVSCSTRPCQQSSRRVPSLPSRGTLAVTSCSAPRLRSVKRTSSGPVGGALRAASRSCASTACTLVTVWPQTETRRSPSATRPSQGPLAVTPPTCKAEPCVAPNLASHAAEGRMRVGKRRSFGNSALRNSSSSEGTLGMAVRPSGRSKCSTSGITACAGMP